MFERAKRKCDRLIKKIEHDQSSSSSSESEGEESKANPSAVKQEDKKIALSKFNSMAAIKEKIQNVERRMSYQPTSNIE